MPKVAKIKLLKPVPNAECLSVIKDVVKDIRSGMVTDIAIVGLRRDGKMMRGWTRTKNCGDTFRMVGSIEKLREEYLRKEIEA